jgi:triacylglycerol lipase
VRDLHLGSGITMSSKLDFALAVLNGAVGDYLARTGNGLATEMTWVRGGRSYRLDREALARELPAARPRLAILVHGLMCTETVWRAPDGSDYGALLDRDFGFEPLHVRYNTGLAVAENGARLATMLEALVDAYPVPVEEILLLGYSMGGLVVRSACHVAGLEGQRWLPLARRAIYVGTPHLGAPLERVGRTVAKALRAVGDPYARLVADLGDLRSDGVKDLGDADLRHEDRARPAGFGLRDARHPVPLLPSMRHYLVAGALWRDPWLAGLFGDAVVSLASATDGAYRSRETTAFPPGHVAIVQGLDHVNLPRCPEVYEQIRAWCSEEVS